MSGALRMMQGRKPAAGGPAFDPTSISGLVTWASADEITGKSDGDTVLSWTDRSGNGRHWTEATNGPLYKTNILNGLPVLRFVDQSAHQLATAATSLGPNYTLFVVAKRNVSGTGNRGVIDSDQSPNRLFQYRWVDSSRLDFITFNSGSGVAGSDSQSLTETNWNIHTGLRGTNTAQVFINGASDGSTATSGTNATWTNSLRVGRWQGGWSSLDLAEVLFYDSALGSTDRGDVESYLSDKYGISL